MSYPRPVVSVSVEMLILGWFLSHHYSETIYETFVEIASMNLGGDINELPVVSVSVEMLILGWFLMDHYSEKYINHVVVRSRLVLRSGPIWSYLQDLSCYWKSSTTCNMLVDGAH